MNGASNVDENRKRRRSRACNHPTLDLRSLQEQLQAKTADCHLAHQHVASAQKALQALEADHQKAMFHAAAAAQDERLRAAARIAELEALAAFHEAEFRRKGEEAEALRAERNVGAARVAELEGEVQRVRGLLAKADEEVRNGCNVRACRLFCD